MRWLIEKEGDELLSPDDEGVKDVMRKLPGAVESWTKEKMRILAGLLPGSRRVDVDGVRFSDDLTGDASSIDSPPPFIDEPDLLLSNLTTSVSTCLGSTLSSIRAVDVARVCTFLFPPLRKGGADNNTGMPSH